MTSTSLKLLYSNQVVLSNQAMQVDVKDLPAGIYFC